MSHIFYQRCFWLFVVLVVLIAAVSFVPANDQGRLVLNLVNMFLPIAEQDLAQSWFVRLP